MNLTESVTSRPTSDARCIGMFSALTLTVLLSAGTSTAQEPDRSPVTFSCDDGTAVAVTWISGDPVAARLERDGETRYLTQTVAASGARFESADTLFWNRGAETIIEWDQAQLRCSLVKIDPWDSPADLATELDRFVEEAMKWYEVPGAAVAVIHGDRRIVRTWGERKRGTGLPVDADTRFAIASVTKAITADLAAVAVDRGVLEWDEPITRHIPDLVLADDHTTRNVTVRHALSHQIGFPAFAADAMGSVGWSSDELVRRLRHLPLVAPLGTEANYSNPGIFLGGLAASRALGAESFEQAVHEELFEPLNMTRSDFFSGVVSADSNTAFPHLSRSDQVVSFDTIYYSNGFAPSGAVVTSIDDLANWLEMHVRDGVFRDRRILTTEVIDEFGTRTILEDPTFAEMAPISEISGFSYGIVWGIYPYQGYQVMEKGGARGGFRSVVVLVPEADLAIGVLTNLGLTAFPEAVRAWVLEEILGNDSRVNLQADIRDAQQQVNTMFATVLDAPQPDRSIRPDLPLDTYVGSYENPLYGTLEIRLVNGRPEWRLGDRDNRGAVSVAGYNTLLLHAAPGKISYPEEATFLIGPDEQPVEIHTDSYGTFTRVTEEN